MDIYGKLQEIVKKKVKNKNVTAESDLKDLGMDSLDKADVIVSIEEVFDIEFTDEEMVSVAKVQDIIDLIEKKLS